MSALAVGEASLRRMNATIVLVLLAVIQAWIRLSINLEHCAEHRGCLDALRCGYDDEHVRGGDRVEIRDRLSSKNNKYGKRVNRSRRHIVTTTAGKYRRICRIRALAVIMSVCCPGGSQK